MPNLKAMDLTGLIVGRLEVRGRAPAPTKAASLKYLQQSWWLVRCKCGETAVKPREMLRSGDIKSCGCLRREWGTLVLSRKAI